MKKSTAITIITLLALLAIGSTTFGIVKMREANISERYIAANYRHAFSELVTGMSDVDAALQKSLLVTSPCMAGAVCTEVYGKAQMANMALAVLPFSYYELEKTSGFIGKVGDYAYTLSRKAARGEAFTQEDKDNLRVLSETATLLAQNFRAMEEDLGSGLVDTEQYKRTIENYDKNEGVILVKTLGDSMSAAEKEFPEMPALIYDGPFSDSLDEAKPRMLEGKPEVDKNAARNAAAQFIGVRPEQVYLISESNGKLPSYLFEAKINGYEVDIQVSKQGGTVYEAVSSRPVSRSELSAKEAIDAAKKFLERRGYSNLKESYYLVNNNILTANFAYQQDGVVCYSDLIKVAIALDDGSLHSFEAKGYLNAHYDRTIQKPAISIDQARNKVPKDVNILSSGLSLIPTEGKNEILCYEYICEGEDEQKYIVYVNAYDGEQERIFILLEDENGTLTI